MKKKNKIYFTASFDIKYCRKTLNLKLEAEYPSWKQIVQYEIAVLIELFSQEVTDRFKKLVRYFDVGEMSDSLKQQQATVRKNWCPWLSAF